MSEEQTEAELDVANALVAQVEAAQRQAFREIAGSFFTLEEFRCKCDVCQDNPLDSEWFETEEFVAFMAKLGTLRSICGFAMPVNSGHRCPAYNDQIYVDRGADPGEHLEGPHTIGAADVGVHHQHAYIMDKNAKRMDLGVGAHQRGEVADRYIHVDNQGPRIWTY